MDNETRAKIFGLYPECRVKVTTVTTSFEGTMIGFISGKGWEPQCKVVTDNGGTHWYDLEQAQLLLYDLAQITDDDCVECYRIDCDPRTFDTIKRDFKIQAVKSEIQNPYAISFRVADFLRSKFYALPAYGVQDLFAEGVAIVKPKNEKV